MLVFAGLAQKLQNRRNAFTAFRFDAQAAVHHRYCKVFALKMGSKFAIGDPIANTHVHSQPTRKLTTFIMGKLRSIRNIIRDLGGELPHLAAPAASPELNLSDPEHEYVQIPRYSGSGANALGL